MAAGPSKAQVRRMPEEVTSWIDEVGEGDEPGLLSAIREAMEDDTDPEGKETRRLLRQYLKASPSERRVIDTVLTTVCGWTLSSLLHRGAPEAVAVAFDDAVLETGGSDF